MPTARSVASLLAFVSTLALVHGCTKLESASDVFTLVSGGANAGGTSSTGSGGASLSGGTASAQGGITTARGGSASAAGGRANAAGGSAVMVAGQAGALGEGGSAGSGGAPDECLDPTGFQGLGCYSCEPRDVVSLENACSDSLCTRFANDTRLELLEANGALPALPLSNTATGGASGVGGASAVGGAPALGGAPAIGGAGGAAATGAACASLASKGELLYVTGSSAAKAYLQQVAQQLAAQNVYLIYTSTGSCVGVDAIVNGTPMTTGAAPAPAAAATYWDGPASAAKSCDLPAGGVNADIGVSDVFVQTCPGFELVNPDALAVRDAHGPIQTMAFGVPINSKQSEISAQAAYFVFGFGKVGGVRDASTGARIWDDETLIFQRSATSGTQAMIAAAVGVPPTKFHGKTHKTSDELAASLQAATADPLAADKAIGIVAADYLVSNPLLQIRPLAYQDTQQRCAVYPDSTQKARDKRNVRDGHYPIWGPLHLLYRVDSSGNPVNPEKRQRVLDVIGYLAGSKPLPNGVSLLDVYAQSGLVPECAMRVTRSKDGGNLVPFRAPSPCSCAFELKATGSTACTPCNVQGNCAANETCSLGYCEH